MTAVEKSILHGPWRLVRMGDGLWKWQFELARPRWFGRDDKREWRDCPMAGSVKKRPQTTNGEASEWRGWYELRPTTMGEATENKRLVIDTVRGRFVEMTFDDTEVAKHYERITKEQPV